MAGWRTIIVTERCKLDLRYGNMNIRKNDELKQVNINEIGVLLVESTSVSLTSALLSELLKNKVKIIFCDEKHNPQSELVPYYGAHDSSDKIRKQINWKTNIKQEVWTRIVEEKIRNQMLLLKYFGLEQYKLLEEYINQIEYYDATNREGHAAKVYFNALYGMEFSRNAQEYVVNAAMDYGYAIILALFNREIVSNGYLTNIGIFHRNTFNHFNLSCDLMEPFRPLIDKCVIEMNPQKFEIEEKRIIQRLISIQLKIGDREYYLPDVIKIYTKSVLDSLECEDKYRIRFFRNEL